MAEFAKNALVELSPEGGKFYVDGVEFPFHITGFSVDTVQGTPKITVTIPLEQGVMVNFDTASSEIPVVESVDPEPNHTPYPAPGDKLLLRDADEVLGSTEPPRDTVWVTTDSSRSYLRYEDKNNRAEWWDGWYWGDEDASSRYKGPWTWSDLLEGFKGRDLVFHGKR